MDMRRLKLVGLVASLLVTLAQAGNGGDSGWGSSSCATVYSTVWSASTEYVPTTTTEEKTVYSTETDYVTVTTTDTVYVTDTTTQISVQPTTIVDVITETDIESTTIVSPITILETTTVVKPTTIVSPTTVVSVSTVISVQLSTVTDTIPTTVISVSATTATVSTYPGLVTCTSRIVNPTYTPKAPLPTNYLWGCAPGTICTPPQIGCNWEQNPPADTYVCAPEECKPVPELFLPANLSSLWPNPTESTCAWDEAPQGYFHLNPQHFGLSFAIFDVYGQPLCPAPTTTSTWADWSTIAKPTPPARPTSTWAPKMPRRGLMANPIAEIVSRQNFLSAPAQCYRIYDAASQAGQAVGLVYDLLCPASTTFQQALTQCRACAQQYAGSSTGTETFPELQNYFQYCQTHTS
ncbi:uncharacterized protein Z519_07923 [Cladophialophora bantiana CBS 173.52]|uniref:Ig-like domain-containing protein n=1 Tax=Cladophialophora bantiana (strain ATCC 10958 / CBS 173.52 / CDC B-1940 / NIH 8579) TaxID=1442370 RepID=A0A0D2I2F6_CLAB1|nr:uncharacterized protein Z519_07923 [Cladophialophora bantiana CBS 173.52]KIW91029.1 hypothetical protein Z519_07923 [Cladophialophora bantiana CBS 173.52]